VLETVGAASAHDVWIFSAQGQYLRLIGTKWTSGRLPRETNGGIPQSVKVFGPDDVWAFGYRGCSKTSMSGCRPYAARFNGRTWRVFAVPGKGLLGEVSALSANDIWTISGATEPGDGNPHSRPLVVHWNGTAWRVAPVQPKLPPKAQLSAITVMSASDIWVGGAAFNSLRGSYELVRHWNGKTWASANPITKPNDDQTDMEDLVPDGSGGIWELALTGYDDVTRLRHFSHGHWQAPAAVGWLLVHLAAVPDTDSTWGVGTNLSVSLGLIVLHGPTPH
jgi:hypothetical protein